jgi:ArsR family transcriptional regulator, arsenate/arsenite/antimonite-responsive transcriptional repressor / arsenate reductase (thioredoxin)
MTPSRLRVLFLCTGNSARSQMAEALLNHHAGESFEAFSAGTHPEEVHPLTLSVLNNLGIDTPLRAKHLDELDPNSFDYVITLCDNATQECKSLGALEKKMEWSFSDPKAHKQDGLSDIERFQHALSEINRRIQSFILVELGKPGPNSNAPETISPIQLFKSMSDELRLQCLMLVQYEGELCVCELMAALEDEQPKVSRHLALLRKSGLLVDRKLGQWVFYRINPDLPTWAKAILSETTDANIYIIKDAISRLAIMNDRPTRVRACC